MKITSFIKHGLELKPVDIEINLISGLPQIQIMGLPDTTIKESQLRIKSAIKSQGFDFPRQEQILVNLRPNDLRKSSKGIDLAIALAFLLKTNQIPESSFPGKQIFVYGGLSLQGDVYVPDDLDNLVGHNSQTPVITGPSQRGYDFPLLSVKDLRSLSSPSLKEAQTYHEKWTRPELRDLMIPAPLAEVLKVSAVGEHKILFAGPAGSGKTTAAECLFRLIRDPSAQEFRSIQKVARILGQKVPWRPFVSPHHTTPLHSMVGGGNPPVPGEVTRAHNGVLFLDELLEFKNPVRESLREPIESGQITVSRLGRVQKYPAKFQLISTSNLCPCGSLVPGKPTRCRYSLTKCRGYLERLSGPLLDRFEILSLSHKWKDTKAVALPEVLQHVQRAQKFQQSQGRGFESSSPPSVEELLQQTEEFSKEHFIPKGGQSMRRKQALMRVARSFADLDEEPIIQAKHIDRSSLLTIKPFKELERCFN